jgi:hypothetical protein
VSINPTNATTQITPAILTGTIAPSLPSDTDTISVSWGDGTTSPATVNNITHSFVATHVYLSSPPGQPNGSYTAVITASDENGVTATATAAIQVLTEPPQITTFAPNQATITKGGSVTVTGSFTDPGVSETHTAQIDWGDGTTSPATITEANGSGTFTATHVYANNLLYANGAPTPYVLTATVTNANQVATIAQTQVRVSPVTPAIASPGEILAYVGASAPLEAAPLSTVSQMPLSAMAETNAAPISLVAGNPEILFSGSPIASGQTEDAGQSPILYATAIDSGAMDPIRLIRFNEITISTRSETPPRPVPFLIFNEIDGEFAEPTVDQDISGWLDVGIDLGDNWLMLPRLCQ